MKKIFLYLLKIQFLLLLIACNSSATDKENSKIENDNTNKIVKPNEEELDTLEIKKASSVILNSFLTEKKIDLGKLSSYLETDSIKINLEHSITGDTDIFYLKDNKKIEFFTKPSTFKEFSSRKKTELMKAVSSCCEFEITEGLLHNSLYLKKLCFEKINGNLLLIEIFILDGD